MNNGSTTPAISVAEAWDQTSNHLPYGLVFGTNIPNDFKSYSKASGICQLDSTLE